MFVGMPLVPLLCLLYGDPMLKNLRSLFHKIQWGHTQTISQSNEITVHHQNHVHHLAQGKPINANVQSPFTEVIYNFSYF